jgi:hypothetical protein
MGARSRASTKGGPRAQAATLYPFTPQGDLLSYASQLGKRAEVLWLAGQPFEDRLEFVCFEKGGHGLQAIWRSVKNKRRYPMFMDSLRELLLQGILHRGRVTGRWSFITKGSNFGIVYQG